jgi:hypothetical protein
VNDPIVTISMAGDKFEIHVTNGNGKGTAVIMSKLTLVSKKKLAVFAPEITEQARTNVEALGVEIFTGQDELMDWIEVTR